MRLLKAYNNFGKYFNLLKQYSEVEYILLQNSLILFLIFILVSCSKNQLKLSCYDASIKKELLNNIDLPLNGFFYYSLSNLKLIKSNNSYFTCSASLKFQSILNSNNILIIPVNYKVYKIYSINNKDISNLYINGDNTLKYLKWINELNLYVAHLGDYQKTPYGSLFVLKDNFKQGLYFNGELVNPAINNNTVSIEKNYLINNGYIFIIGSYSNAVIDQNLDNNYLVYINKNTFYVSPAFSYKEKGISQRNNILYIIGSLQSRPYAESDDFPIYSFENGVFKTIKKTKDDIYYQQKFSRLTSEDVVSQAINDNCYDVSSQKLTLDKNCNYAGKYCYEFKYINDVNKNNDYYKSLEQSCSN